MSMHDEFVQTRLYQPIDPRAAMSEFRMASLTLSKNQHLYKYYE